MNAAKYDATGTKSGEVTLPAEIFATEISKGAIYAVLRSENRNRRQGTHKTKMFGEVRGGGRKPYRQKGTGNARQGSIRAPQYKGGAIVFGPQPRDYTVRIPNKMRRVGLRSILGLKAKLNAISVLSDPKLTEYSTKSVNNIFKSMGLIPSNTVALLIDSSDHKLLKSTMNIPQVVLVQASRMTAPELYYAGHLVVAESALKYLTENYATDK